MLRRILIVEDDEALRHFYRGALQIAGYQTEEAADGLAALRVIDQQPPDLVILDLGLPVVGGLVVQEEIAATAQHRRIPVLVITGSTELLDGLDVDCVLRKPVSFEGLLDAVGRCLQFPP